MEFGALLRKFLEVLQRLDQRHPETPTSDNGSSDFDQWKQNKIGAKKALDQVYAPGTNPLAKKPKTSNPLKTPSEPSGSSSGEREYSAPDWFKQLHPTQFGHPQDTPKPAQPGVAPSKPAKDATGTATGGRIGRITQKPAVQLKDRMSGKDFAQWQKHNPNAKIKGAAGGLKEDMSLKELTLFIIRHNLWRN